MAAPGPRAIRWDAFEEVVVSDRGGGRPRRLPVADVQASWELSAPGSFSCFARMPDLRAAGLGRRLAGMWLEWAHPTAGRWAGVITGRPTNDDGVELSAEGFGSLLRGRLLVEGEWVGAGSAGGLARRAVAAAAALAPTFVTVGSVDEGGEDVGVAFSGDVGDDLLPRIADAGGLEWLVDADRRFHAGRKLGRDRSARVRLVEGVHFVGARFGDDLWLAGQGEAFRLQAPPGRRPRWVPRNAGAAVPPGEVGPGPVQVYDLAPPAAWAPDIGGAPPPWLGQRPGVGANNPAVAVRVGAPVPTVPVQLDLADRGGAWAAFDVGDTVRLEVGSAGFSGRFRVASKAVEAAERSMAVAGEALADEEAG